VAGRRLWPVFAWFAISHPAALVFGLAASALAGRLLGPAGYGTLALLLSAAQFLYGIVVQWSMGALVRFGRESLMGAQAGGKVFWSWLPLAIGSLAVAASLAAASWPWIIRYAVVPRRPSSLLAIGALVTVTACTAALDQLLQTSGRLVGYALGQPLTKLGFLAGLAILCAAPDHATPVGVAAVMAGGAVLQIAARLPAAERRLLVPVSLDGTLLARMASYAVPLVPGYAAAFLSNWVDVLFLRAFRPVAEIGPYYLSYQGFLAAVAPLATIHVVFLPGLLRSRIAGDGDTRWFLERLLPGIIAAWTLVVVTAALAARALVPVVFGPGFEQASRYLAILLVAAAFQVVPHVCSPVYAAYDALGDAARVQLATTGLNVIGDALLVPRYGAMGAAVATALSYAIGAAVSWALIRKRFAPAAVRPLLLPCLAGAALIALAVGSLDQPFFIVAGISCVVAVAARQLRRFASMERARLVDLVASSATGPT
jgi:O-antigen/teichoic acid export membrane protein